VSSHQSLTFAVLFRLLPETENPKQVFVDGVPYVLHEDHRWLLPIAHIAQEAGALPKPCTVVRYDAHQDAFVPPRGAFPELQRLRSEASLEGIVSLCNRSLTSVTTTG
jgi:hypothetical protein